LNHADKAQALERAAAPALAAIVEDEHNAPKWLRPLFAAIRHLLFEPDLKLELIQEAAGFSDPEVWNALRAEVGEPPWSYLRGARLETAARLVLETDISISEIGYLVAYNSPSTFRRPFQAFLGMPPGEYRRQAPRLLQRMERAGPAPDGSRSNLYWERALAGGLSGGEARELDAYLGRLAPATDDSEKGTDTSRGAHLRQTVAEGLAESLDPLPFEQQRRLVRDAVRFPDDAFFQLLSALSEAALGETGTGADPQRGAELALLAIDSLAANGMLETHPEIAALARERLARAQRRAGELPADP